MDPVDSDSRFALKFSADWITVIGVPLVATVLSVMLAYQFEFAGTLGVHTAQLSNLEKSVDGLERKFDVQFAELIRKFDAHAAEMNRRFDAQDQKFEARFAGMEQKFAGMEQKFAGMEQKFETRFAGMERKFDAQSAEFRQRFDWVEANAEVRELDLSKILMSMGLIEKGDSFNAVVFKDFLWLFPGDLVKARLEARELRLEQMTAAVSGFKIAPIGALVGK